MSACVISYNSELCSSSPVQKYEHEIETLLLECYTCTSLCAAQACVLHKHVCCTSMCAAQAKGLIAALSSINFAEFKYVPARRMLETPVEADELGS